MEVVYSEEVRLNNAEEEKHGFKAMMILMMGGIVYFWRRWERTTNWNET